MRTLEVYLLGLFAWTTPAYAAGEMGQIWFGAHAPAGGSATPTPRWHSTDVGETTNVEANAQFRMPSGGNLLNLVVRCEGGPGSGKTFTWLARIRPPGGTDGGTDGGTLTCSINNSDTSCTDYFADSGHIDGFEANDLVTFQVTTTGGTATARDCVIGVQVAGAGDATPVPTPDHSLIVFGDATTVSPGTSPRYGAPSITAQTQELNQAQANEGSAGFVVPVSGLTFTKLCVQLNDSVINGRSETFRLRNSTDCVPNPSTCESAPVTLNGGQQGDCQSISISPNAGDVLTVKFSYTSSAETRTRLVTLEYTGGGGWIGSSAPWATSTKYFTMQEGTNTSASALPQRVSQSGVIRNLYAKASGNPPTPPVITLWKGASTTGTPQMTPQALSVTVPTTPTPVVVSDTTHEILVRQGDYIATEINRRRSAQR